MTKYRKKPIEIDAIQFTGSNFQQVRDQFSNVKFEKTPVASELRNEGFTAKVWDYLHESWVGVSPGMWILQGIKGEYYPCAEDVFESTYEEVENGDS